MSEENKIVSENEGGNMEEKCTCFCKSEWFKKFLTKYGVKLLTRHYLLCYIRYAHI